MPQPTSHHRSRSKGPLGGSRPPADDRFLVSEYKTQFAWVRRAGGVVAARGPEAAPLLEEDKVMLTSVLEALLYIAPTPRRPPQLGYRAREGYRPT